MDLGQDIGKEQNFQPRYLIIVIEKKLLKKIVHGIRKSRMVH